MRLRCFIVCLSLMLLSIASSASIARRGHIMLTQPDGTTFSAIMHGDEFARFRTTTDGHTIMQGEDLWWYYAIYANDGSRQNSGWKVGQEVPTSILTNCRNIPKSQIIQNAAAKRLSATYKTSMFSDIPSKAQTERKGIIILAQFKDIQFKNTKEDFMAMLMSDNYSRFGATGSAREYFESQFGGSVNFSFDVSNIVTLPAKREYYGINNSKGNDTRPEIMIADACELAAADGVDFSQYDINLDGKVDNVFVFFAGEDEAEGADESSIWSHAWYLFSGAGISLELNGKMIDRYACSSEMTRIHDKVSGKLLETRLSGIGTFCHEYSHTFGLPDLYDTDYDEHGGWAAGLWGSTSLMDSGNQNNQGNTPPYFNAIEREILGISVPVLIETDGKYNLSPIERAGEIYRIDTDKHDEYYLLECRDGRTGNWDEFIGGSGMLVYHVDKSKSFYEYWDVRNKVNAYADHQCADLIEADGRSDMHPDYHDYLTRRDNLEGLFFPHNKTDMIPAYGTPGLNFWSGSKGKVSITGIHKENDGSIGFSVIGFTEESTPPAVKGDITYETFCDGVILKFESDRAHNGEAFISFGKTGDESIELSVSPYQEGKYAILLNGLDPVTTYTASIHFEMNEVKGTVSSVSFMTKKQPVVTWPYISFGSAMRNNNGTFVTGTRIPLKINNSKDIKEVSWTFNGTPITHDGDHYYTLNSNGALVAHIYMEDGREEILVKDITTSAMSIQ